LRTLHEDPTAFHVVGSNV